MAETPPEPTREDLARRLAELEKTYAANTETLARLQATIAELTERLPKPPKVISWWALCSFILAWGVIFHLLVR